ncbi:hypothetical protein O6H91_22G048500 [Diphasiastrum complanatum]|uniref:Uncharacterized protein n=1 Tax=Diphasiastrum complanatum TaxID=34168 RepID=A0ACC2AFA9_DIPCM|nr:hypothetical protein O6H91_22G048500 [Diphasiastrum complanatum]
MVKPEIDIYKQSNISAHPHMSSVGCVECEAYHYAFCMECIVPWHGNLTCAQYQYELTTPEASGDKKLLQLAKSLKWQRCKNCAQIIERRDGCNHITCLCGHRFCYVCGAVWIKMKTCNRSYLKKKKKILSQSSDRKLIYFTGPSCAI